MNQVILQGNSGSDVELKYTPNGMAVANISLATSEVNYKTKEQTTIWHEIVLFGKTAEAKASKIKKGTPLMVVGKLQYNEWEKNGVKMKKAQVAASRIYIIDNSQSQMPQPLSSEGDLPF